MLPHGTLMLPKRDLIANRGEVSVRVTRTCHAAGIEVVAVYSPEDQGSPHINAVNRAVEVPSYVDIIGRPATAMEIMGDKTEAHAAMVEAGAPIVPGSVPGDAVSCSGRQPSRPIERRRHRCGPQRQLRRCWHGGVPARSRS